MLRPVLAGSLVVAALLVAVPASAVEPAKKAPPPADHGFPLEDYLRGLVKGKLFVGGTPPAFVGAKTKDTVFVVGGRAHYQPQVALRRAGRDDGKGRFLVLRARSWGSAMAYVIKLDPGIVWVIRVALPKFVVGRPFPPLYAGITYSFSVSPESDKPVYKPVDVASQPHPDPELRRRNITLVTLKKGLKPGGYAIRVIAEVELRPHPLKSLYDAYETVTGVIEWATIAAAPAEVALEKLVDKGIEVLVDAAAEGDPKAIATLGKQATREQVAKKVIEEAVKSVFVESTTIYRFEVPTVVPEVRGLTKAQAQAALEQRFLRWTYRKQPTTSAQLVGRIMSQEVKAGQKRKVGTTIALREYVQATAPPPPTTTAPTPPTTGTSVPFGAPKVVDRIKSLGFQYEPFNVVACDTRVAGACDPRNANSQLRQSARAFCQRPGTTAAPSGANIGQRIGGQAAPYRGESPTSPGTTRVTSPGERWVIVSGQFAGLVGYTYSANVFASINCLR